MTSLAGKKVHVVGMGLSGVSAARLCLRLGAAVTGFDQRPRAELGEPARALPVEIRQGLTPENVAGSELVVVSPGVDQPELFDELAAAGAEVIGELELGARFCGAPICAVGGTNGKSTTTELIAAMAEAAGWRTFCGGNLGTPLCDACGQEWDCLVVEVSSFQLERAPTFRPRVSVLLNITDDHLDRHGTFEAYAAAKGNAFVNQQAGDVAIGPFADAVVQRQLSRGAGRVVHFGDGGDYVVRDGGVLEVALGRAYPLEHTALRARHNRLNAAAAIAAARALGVQPEPIDRALAAYRTLPHRLAHVATLAGVAFYDDSKATNVGAAVAAIESLTEPQVVLIAGGKGKDGSYAPLAAALGARGRAVVLIGEAARVIEQALAGVVPVEHAPTLEAAVQAAWRRAQPGDAVLLAPACASFDMFTSYADRGRRFVQAVGGLTAPAVGGARS
ncbi:MAG TPA: UDP-N-acetylmuramoyl-L-alanine--D-glutamate ligase [Polyangiaceae bacterium]|nr:UDP-N-acetylmuramoyl-L-alanine--D-glutamate ligase [Polyangiaceae bacterium]